MLQICHWNSETVTDPSDPTIQKLSVSCATVVAPCISCCSSNSQRLHNHIPLAIECICEVRKVHSTACANPLTKSMQTMPNTIVVGNNIEVLQRTLRHQSAMCYGKHSILLLATGLKHLYLLPAFVASAGLCRSFLTYYHPSYYDCVISQECNHQQFTFACPTGTHIIDKLSYLKQLNTNSHLDATVKTGL